MLPASTGDRKQRDVTKGRPDGRTVEIQRLIGRALRGIVDFEALGENTIWLDCDVLTRRRRHALRLDHRRLRGARAGVRRARRPRRDLERSPLTGSVAAVSCGIVGGVPLLDLDYSEDSTAEVDANVVMTGDGGLVEVQATAERTPLVARPPRRAAGARRRAGSSELRAVQAGRRSPPADEARPRHAQRAQGARVRRAARAARASTRCPTRSSCRRRPASTFAAQRARQGARGGGGDRRARDRRRLGHRGRRARRRARRALGALRRRATRPTRRTSPSCCAEAPGGQRARLRLRARLRRRPTAPSTSSRAAAPARSPPSPAAAAASATTRPSCPTTSTAAARWPS